MEEGGSEITQIGHLGDVICGASNKKLFVVYFDQCCAPQCWSKMPEMPENIFEIYLIKYKIVFSTNLI